MLPEGEEGATNGTRTRDLRVTNALLYQLSYCGCCRLLHTRACYDFLMSASG